VFCVVFAALLVPSGVLKSKTSDRTPHGLKGDVAFAVLGGEFLAVGRRGGNEVTAYDAAGGVLFTRKFDATVVGLHAMDDLVAVETQDRILEIMDGQGRTVGRLDVGYTVAGVAYDRASGTLAVAGAVTNNAYVLVAENASNMNMTTDFTWYFKTKATPVGIGIDPQTGVIYYASYTGNVYECRRGTGTIGTDIQCFQSGSLLHSFAVDARGQFAFGGVSGALEVYAFYGSETRLTGSAGVGRGRLIVKTSTGGGFAALSSDGKLAFVTGDEIRTVSAPALADVFAVAPDGTVLVISGGRAVYYTPTAALRAGVFRVLFFVALIGLFFAAALAGLFRLLLPGKDARRGEKVRTAIQHTLHGMRKAWKQYLMLLPTFAFLGLFIYIPVVWGFMLAFQNYNGGIFVGWTGFSNFAKVFQDTYFVSSIKNMLIFLAVDLVKAITVPVILAEIMIYIRSRRAQYVSRVLMYLPGILPGVASMLLWGQGILGSGGALNQLFGALGIETLARQDFLGSESSALGAIMLIGFPWIGSYLIVYGALMTISVSLHEAATLDGCGKLRQVFAIDIPMVFPQLKYLFIVAFIGSIQDFNRVYLTTQGLHGTYVPALALYFNINQAHDYGAASAMGILLFLLIFTGSMLLMHVRRGREDDL
jgi:ABC-type sugar transport system permease subunit